jgi:hypothetical protein
MPLCQEYCWSGREVWVRCSCSLIQFVPGGVVGARFYEEVVAAFLSRISQNTKRVCMACLLSSFGTERCRPTFGVFRFAGRGPILTWKEEGEEVGLYCCWVVGRTSMEESEGVGRTWGGWVMNALEFWDDGSGSHFYFCQFADAASLPPEPLTSETSLSREHRKSSWIGSASVLGMRTLRQEKVGDRKRRPQHMSS